MASPQIWIDDSVGNIARVDVQTGTVTHVGNAGVTLSDMAFDPNGLLWGLSFSRLYTINVITGIATQVGLTGIPNGNALVFGTDGTLYAAGALSSNLYTVNTSTGAATSLGNIGFRSAGDLAFHDGNLYLSEFGNKLVRITLGPTVSGSAVGPIGFSNVYGLATGDDGILYGVAGTQVFSVNAATGQGSLLSNYGGQGLFNANGSAFSAEAIPEPAAWCLLAIGLLVVMRRGTRSRQKPGC